MGPNAFYSNIKAKRILLFACVLGLYIESKLATHGREYKSHPYLHSSLSLLAFMLFSFLCDLSTQDSMLFFLACNMRYPLCYHTFTLPYQPCENILFVWMTMFQVVALKRCKGVPSIMGRRYLINC